MNEYQLIFSKKYWKLRKHSILLKKFSQQEQNSPTEPFQAKFFAKRTIFGKLLSQSLFLKDSFKTNSSLRCPKPRFVRAFAFFCDVIWYQLEDNLRRELLPWDKFTAQRWLIFNGQNWNRPLKWTGNIPLLIKMFIVNNEWQISHSPSSPLFITILNISSDW